MHLKRQRIPKNWPIKRKGTTFVVRPNTDLNMGIPILIALRDILKVAQNRKEVKKAIHLKQIQSNGKLVTDEKNSLLFLDVLTIIPSKKHYRLEMSEKGKFLLKEIKSSDASKKIAKIVNKKILRGKKVQLNLSDGRNFLSDIKCTVGDSVLIEFGDKKGINKCLPLKEKSNIVIFAGKHSGEHGTINKIDKESKMAEIKTGEKKINVLIKQFMVLE